MFQLFIFAAECVCESACIPCSVAVCECVCMRVSISTQPLLRGSAFLFIVVAVSSIVFVDQSPLVTIHYLHRHDQTYITTNAATLHTVRFRRSQRPQLIKAKVVSASAAVSILASDFVLFSQASALLPVKHNLFVKIKKGIVA